MKKWCKFCGKELETVDYGWGIWRDPDALVFCSPLASAPFHKPITDDQMVDKILTKYSNEV